MRCFLRREEGVGRWCDGMMMMMVMESEGLMGRGQGRPGWN